MGCDQNTGNPPVTSRATFTFFRILSGVFWGSHSDCFSELPEGLIQSLATEWANILVSVTYGTWFYPAYGLYSKRHHVLSEGVLGEQRGFCP